MRAWNPYLILFLHQHVMGVLIVDENPAEIFYAGLKETQGNIHQCSSCLPLCLLPLHRHTQIIVFMVQRGNWLGEISRDCKIACNGPSRIRNAYSIRTLLHLWSELQMCLSYSYKTCIITSHTTTASRSKMSLCSSMRWNHLIWFKLGHWPVDEQLPKIFTACVEGKRANQHWLTEGRATQNLLNKVHSWWSIHFVTAVEFVIIIMTI